MNKTQDMYRQLLMWHDCYRVIFIGYLMAANNYKLLLITINDYFITSVLHHSAATILFIFG